MSVALPTDQRSNEIHTCTKGEIRCGRRLSSREIEATCSGSFIHNRLVSTSSKHRCAASVTGLSKSCNTDKTTNHRKGERRFVQQIDSHRENSCWPRPTVKTITHPAALHPSRHRQTPIGISKPLTPRRLSFPLNRPLCSLPGLCSPSTTLSDPFTTHHCYTLYLLYVRGSHRLHLCCSFFC